VTQRGAVELLEKGTTSHAGPHTDKFTLAQVRSGVLKPDEPRAARPPQTDIRRPQLKLSILLATPSSSDAKCIAEGLRKDLHSSFDVELVTELSQGIKRLGRRDFDAILADFSLTDSQGREVFATLSAVAPHTPIMMLCSADGDAEVLAAVRRGSIGYFLKEHFTSHIVAQSLRNIIQGRRVQTAILDKRAGAEITLNSIGDAVISTDLFGNVEYLNRAAEVITGWSKAEASGEPIGKIMQIINGGKRRGLPNPIELALKLNEQTTLKAGTIMVRRDGREVAIEDSASPIHDISGKVLGAVIVFHDVTAMRALAMKMEYLAQHDALTSLPNRILLNDRIDRALTHARRNQVGAAVLFLDLDKFKHINDSLGHTIGDKLLQSVAQRLSGCVRRSDTVSRQGGDEFVILLSDYKHAEDASLTAEKIVAALVPPFMIGGHELHITASIGISTYPADAEDSDGLLKNADIAMYHAKSSDRGFYQFFDNSMNVRAVERQLVEVNLRSALQKNELLLHYQPLVNLNTGLITGAEALLRWRHPDWGMTLPSRFVAVAEDSGLIVAMGRWVLREACTQAKRWADSGLGHGSMSVNISALEFRDKYFVENVERILNETDLEPHLLQLEITESVLMQEAHHSSATLGRLKDIGVGLAIDDFGTGFSSLSYLIRFPIDVLKIDQTFVQAISSKKSSEIIVNSVIAMGASLNQRVVAEGVESEFQLEFLKQRHCEEGQGYLFSKPVSGAQFSDLLSSGLRKRGLAGC
jgi:diguanylate cyclase (GGDEF)-like protein/PAS domain S-box-containing protein